MEGVFDKNINLSTICSKNSIFIVQNQDCFVSYSILTEIVELIVAVKDLGCALANCNLHAYTTGDPKIAECSISDTR